MATIAFLTSCCVANVTEGKETTLDRIVIGHVLDIVSIIFCSISLLGVAYLVVPRRENRSQWWRNPNRILTGPNLNGIIRCIIAVSCLGTIGLLIRSIVWMSGHYPFPRASTLNFAHIFCMIITFWIEYMFLCNHFQHIIYGIEALLVANNKEMSKCLKVFVGWIAPALLCGSAGVVIYYKGVNKCHDDSLLDRGAAYLMTLTPILIVFIFNPIIFYQASKAAKRALIWHYGRYTYSERKLVDAVHLKFILIMTAYGACWITNVISAVLRLSGDDKFEEPLLAVWILMAVLNPLQAVLATLVFWGWPENSFCRTYIHNSRYDASEYTEIRANNINASTSRSHTHSQPGSIRSESESEPLISFSRKR